MLQVLYVVITLMTSIFFLSFIDDIARLKQFNGATLFVALYSGLTLFFMYKIYEYIFPGS